MNIISTDNLKNISQSFLRNLIQSSSEINGCPITNILEKETKSIWLSEEFLPQEIILHINKSYFKYFPKKLSTIGIYCWHAYSTNPKLIEILISINNSNNYISLGNFDLGLKPGMQLLQLDEDLLLDNDENKLNENIFIKIIIKETFGGKRTYINNLSLYEDIDLSTMNLKSIQEENDEEDTSVVYLHESRIKNNLKKQKKLGTVNNNINNGNILLTSEILISDSDLSDRKIFGDKVDKFLGINSGKKENNNSSLKKINNNKIIISKNNIIKSKNNKKDASPIKSNTPIKQDKNIIVSDKKSLLNSNIFSGNNNIINTQTSQNNMNNQLLTTEMLQNDFFTPEKQNKFYNSKGEISNIEFIGENQSLINEFRAYQKSQEEKHKKLEERITNIENKINDMNSTIIDITNNLNDLIQKEKSKEKESYKEKEKERELILKDCEKMIKITLIEILEKKLNFDEEKIQTNKKITRIKNKVKQNSLKNYNSNKIPESKLSKYNENFYQTYYNINNNNQNTIDYSYNQNITLDPNNNYLTHKLPFYQNMNNNSINNSNNNSNNNIIFNHRRNSTFSLNYLNKKNNLDLNNNINNSQNIPFENKFNISSNNNYSQISESYLKEKINNSHRNRYYDFKSDINTSHTPMNFSNYKIPHNNTHYGQNIKNNMKDSIPSKEQTIKLKKNKSNFSNLSSRKNNTISNSHQNSQKKISLSKRQHSHSDLRSKDDIENKINNHLEEKFADIGDKIGKNINESLLKPSLAKIKKIMKKNLKQVRNSIKKAEVNQRSVRYNNSYNS